jgi:hypothetical protein
LRSRLQIIAIALIALWRIQLGGEPSLWAATGTASQGHFDDPYCGDGWCQAWGCVSGGPGSPGNGCEEDNNNGPSDCIDFVSVLPPPEHPNWHWPDDGVNWWQNGANDPSDDAAGGCDGNCGPGCSAWDVCGAVGSGRNYWSYVVNRGPDITDYGMQQACDGPNLVQGELYQYEDIGYWDYHGTYADGCSFHDFTCRNSFDIWPGCWLGSDFLIGGACAGEAAQDWYDFTNLTLLTMPSEQVVSYYYSGCYSGPPICGDGICQSDGCVPGGPGTPGNGCEEDSSSCPQDCSGGH